MFCIVLLMCSFCGGAVGYFMSNPTPFHAGGATFTILLTLITGFKVSIEASKK